MLTLDGIPSSKVTLLSNSCAFYQQWWVNSLNKNFVYPLCFACKVTGTVQTLNRRTFNQLFWRLMTTNDIALNDTEENNFIKKSTPQKLSPPL